jgi:hypothetical protein
MVAVACLAAACNSNPPATVVPTPAPTPIPTATADPHLTAPAKADDVFLALRKAGLRITPNTASTGGEGRDPVKEIDATYEGWPLTIGQYRSAATLLSATHWKPGGSPGPGEAPIEFIGLNILVRWGPIATGLPAQTLDPRQLSAATALRDGLDRLLSPLTSRTTVDLPGSAPSVTPSPTPGASPKPSAKPSASS